MMSSAAQVHDLCPFAVYVVHVALETSQSAVCVGTRLMFCVLYADSDTGRDGGQPKRRRTRWGADEHDKTFIPGMPTVLPTNLDSSQEQAYLSECPRRQLAGGGGPRVRATRIYKLHPDLARW